jgi:hypothetical protein
MMGRQITDGDLAAWTGRNDDRFARLRSGRSAQALDAIAALAQAFAALGSPLQPTQGGMTVEAAAAVAGQEEQRFEALLDRLTQWLREKEPEWLVDEALRLARGNARLAQRLRDGLS